MPVVRMRDTRLNPGGLMRCCEESLAGYAEPMYRLDKEVETGTTLECLYCDQRVILTEEKVWKWLPKETQA